MAKPVRLLSALLGCAVVLVGCSLNRPTIVPADAGAMDAPSRLDVPGLDVPAVDVPGLDAPDTPLDAPLPDVPGLDAPPDIIDTGVDAPIIDTGVDAPIIDTGVDAPPARLTCLERYGWSTTTYQECIAAADTECEFYVALGGGRSCDDFCMAGGGMCVGAHNNMNSGGGRCTRSGVRFCATNANDYICVCTHP